MKRETLLFKNFILFLLFTFFLLTSAQSCGGAAGDTMEKQKFNHLFLEKSPYLQQHVFNPVNWYPWGEEALSIACREDKPIFLSIGYSTCHWCHVMERESFEDHEIADFLNRYFVSIKVDREERPGIDQLYMAATLAMTGGGGWPMSVFLLPDTKPFYAGTYFPPKAAYGRPGFLEIITAVQKAWQTDRKNLELSAEQVTMHIREGSVAENGEKITPAWMHKGFKEIAQNYEPHFGGFGQAPKFPRPVVFDFLFRYYAKTAEREARDIALSTIDHMAAGGIYDHLGGGFHRYSVDKQWRVPHFEKMLYDQSQLASIYLSAYQLNANGTYKEVAVEILEYVLRQMQSPEGGFYSAEDADSDNPYNPGEHSEGAYYLWTESELSSLLSADEERIVKRYYGVEKNGNALHDPQQEFIGRNILYQASDVAEVARETKLSEKKVVQLLQTAKGKLLKQRETRIPPHLDDKIITAWNGLMISALSRAAVILEEKRFLEAANRAAEFLLDNLVVNGNLKRRFRDGEAKYSAGLDDYSFLIQGLLDLYTAGHDVSRLRHAIKLTEQQIEKFTDTAGGFYDTPQSTDLLVRLKETSDGAEPSGNSVAAMNFLRLSVLLDKPEWAEIASKGMASFSKILSNRPSAMPLMLSALGMQLDDTSLHVVIVGEKNSDDTRLLLREIHSRYLPNTTLVLADDGANQRFLEKYQPFLKTVEKIEKKATAYVCEGFTCKMPVNRPEDLAALLDNRSKQGSEARSL